RAAVARQDPKPSSEPVVWNQERLLAAPCFFYESRDFRGPCSRGGAMSTTGLDVFDKTIQTTNIWLDEIMARMGPDRQVAWHILGAVLRPLRDRLPLDDAAHLGAQLPLLVRGLYYDQWHSPSTMNKDRHQEEFLARVEHGLRDTRLVNVHDAARTVFAVLCKHVAPGQA